ncbi:MAG TPA: TetR/AcrR family transcriptional regulator [Nocardioidaceae bacterium]|nr:TetR/AcrR family transcriptional regulator [Nocardioidaceae bacterium]
MAGNTGTKGVPREEREQQILDVAVEEFGRRAYANASMTRIAEAAGISKPLIYSYFDSKDGLFLACLHRAGANLVEQVEAAQTGPMLSRALDTLAAIVRTLEPRRYDWAVLYDATLPEGTAVHDTAMQYRKKLAALGAAGVTELLAGKANPDDASLLTHLWLHSVSAAVGWWLEHPEETAESITARVMRLASLLAESAR